MFGLHSRRTKEEEQRLAQLEVAENRLADIAVELQGVSERAQIRVDTLGVIVDRLEQLKGELSRERSNRRESHPELVHN